MRIECIKFEEVAMRSAGRTWTAITQVTPTVDAVQTAVSELSFGGRGLLKSTRGSGEVVDHPMYPGAAGRVRIIHDERK